MRVQRAVITVPLLAGLAISEASGQTQRGGPDVFAFVSAIDAAGAGRVWPGFDPSAWPVALFDGNQTILLRHPNPPGEFAPMPDRAGVLRMPGRHPAVVSNSTREIAGVRTATVVATPDRSVESTMLASIEEVFHVFFLGRHANVRPNEMVRYGYPVKAERNLALLLAEDEALARALEAGSAQQAATWVAAALRIRRERVSGLGGDVRAFETALEMMEGTANYVARVAVGEAAGATAARLREPRAADGIRWRFYDSGAAVCLLLDRFEPGWKTRIDAEPEVTIADLLDSAVARSGEAPAAFTAEEISGFETAVSAAIAELSARQSRLREELLGRGGFRVLVEVAAGAAPLLFRQFDPINLLVLDSGEVVHARSFTLAGPEGTIELANPRFARGSYAGTVAMTVAAGHHPLGEGIRRVTIVGLTAAPRVEERDGVLTVEAEGLRMSLRGTEARTEGETVLIRLGSQR